MFDPVPLPQLHAGLAQQDAVHRLLGEIHVWIMSPPLRALAAEWGAEPPASGADLADVLDWYDRFSSQHWDFRRGQERNLAAAATLNESQETAALNSAQALGLAESRPPSLQVYDYVLILGGLVRACVVRARYASSLTSQGLEAGQIIALGGFRPLRGDELELLGALGLRAENEFGAMVEGIRKAFPATGEVHHLNDVAGSGNLDWQVAEFAGDPRLRAVAAPSSDPDNRRANTRDTYHWWARRQLDVKGAKVLVLTTNIYVPYQGSVATEVLGLEYGADVETIGVPMEVADLGEQTQVYRPDQYLQEVRSAIAGYRELALRARAQAATLQ